MNINLQEIYQEELKKLENEDFVRTQIRKGLEETLTKSIKESLTSWDFRKIIENKFVETAGEEVKNITFKGYGEFFKAQMLEIMETIEKNELQNMVYESTKEFFEAEKEISLEDLIENYRETNLSDDYEDYDKHFYLHINNEYSHAVYVYIDEDSDLNSEYSAEYTIKINKNTGIIDSVKIHGKEVKGQITLGTMDNFDKRLLKAYFNKTKITDLDIDADYCDTRLSNADY